MDGRFDPRVDSRGFLSKKKKKTSRPGDERCLTREHKPGGTPML